MNILKTIPAVIDALKAGHNVLMADVCYRIKDGDLWYSLPYSDNPDEWEVEKYGLHKEDLPGKILGD